MGFYATYQGVACVLHNTSTSTKKTFTMVLYHFERRP